MQGQKVEDHCVDARKGGHDCVEGSSPCSWSDVCTRVCHVDPGCLVGPENLEDLDLLESSHGLFSHLGKEEVYPLLVDCERDEICKFQGQASSSHGLVQQELRVVFHEDRLVSGLEFDVAPVDFEGFVY